MSFNFNIGDRPSSHWNNSESPLKREITPLHDHEFGLGRDIQYKDISGKVQARLDGLRPWEADYLKSIKY